MCDPKIYSERQARMFCQVGQMLITSLTLMFLEVPPPPVQPPPPAGGSCTDELSCTRECSQDVKLLDSGACGQWCDQQPNLCPHLCLLASASNRNCDTHCKSLSSSTGKRNAACSSFCDRNRDLNCDVDSTVTCTTGEVQTYDEKIACSNECRGGDVAQIEDANHKCSKWCTIDPERCASVCDGVNAQSARCDFVCPAIEASKRSAACRAFCQLPGACPLPGAETCEQPDAAIATVEGQRCQRVCSRNVAGLRLGTKCATWCANNAAECAAICTGPNPADTCGDCQASPPPGEPRNGACEAWCNVQPANTCAAPIPVCTNPWTAATAQERADCQTHCSTSAALNSNGVCAAWCALNPNECRAICDPAAANNAPDCATCKTEPADSRSNCCKAYCATNTCEPPIPDVCPANQATEPVTPICDRDCSRSMTRINDEATGDGACSFWCGTHEQKCQALCDETSRTYHNCVEVCPGTDPDPNLPDRNEACQRFCDDHPEAACRT